MKILAIGDPHGCLDKIKKISVKNIDLILLTGDLGNADLARQMAFENINRKKQGLDEIEYSSAQKKKAFMQAYNSAIQLIKYLSQFAPVYTIFGNVESSNSETRKESKEIGEKLPFLYNDLKKIKNVRVINNRIANFRNLRIGGLEYFVDVNWVMDFKPDKYSKKLKSARKDAKKAKEVLRWFDRLDILVCHQPPYGILDKVGKDAPKHWKGKHAGSKVILYYIRKYQPAYVFCGHIHEAEGMEKVGETEVYNLGVAGYKIVEL